MTSQLTLLAEPRRQQIMQEIWECELSAGVIHERVGSVTFGAISQHLKLLRDAQLVVVRKAGRQRFYRANKEGLGALADYLDQMWGDQLAKLKRLAERAEST